MDPNSAGRRLEVGGQPVDLTVTWGHICRFCAGHGAVGRPRPHALALGSSRPVQDRADLIMATRAPDNGDEGTGSFMSGGGEEHSCVAASWTATPAGCCYRCRSV